jgi:PAS domain S-box-containing protein
VSPLRIASLSALAVLLTGAAVLVIATSDRGFSGTAAVALAVGISFNATGVVAVARQPWNRTGALMLAVGYLWALGALQESSSSVLFTVGVLTGQLAFVPFALLLLAYPTGVLERAYHRRLVAAVLVTLVVGPLSIALVDPTPREGCDGCPANAAVVWEQPGLGSALGLAFTIAVVALAAVFLVELVRRYRTATPPLRHTLTPVYAAFALSLVFLILANATDAFSDRVATALGIVALVFIALIPVAFLAGLLRGRLARGSVAELVIAIGQGVPLRDALAGALGDPSLEIAYWLDREQRWADAEGRPLETALEHGRRTATIVEHEGRRVAALVHDASLTDQPELVQAVAATAGLSLSNERVQAELRNQLSVLETAIGTAPSLLSVVDTEGRITSFNRAVERATGLDDPAQIRGKPFWEIFIDPSERDEMVARFRAAAPAFPAAEYENAFTNARGEHLVIGWQSAPIADETGKVVAIVAGGLDVTERKRRELELQLERDNTNTLVQSIPTLIVVVDENGVVLGQEGRAGVNRAFRETLGWDDRDVAGRSVLELIDPDDAYLAVMAIGSAANGVPSPERESRWLHADGTHIVMAWTATSMPDPSADERVLVLISGTDVTERKAQEEEIRASRARIVQAADEARRLLERNLHDGAQQRLVSLSLSLRLAEAKLRTDPEGAASVLAGAREELALALDELRELARGIHPAILTDRGLAAALEALVARAPVPVELEVPEERLPEQVEAAAYYVVAEALTNVAKYAGPCSAHVRVREDGEEGLVTVEVLDDGAGGADPERGSGLRGLADRVAALDGRLAVESAPGSGTRVAAEIPVRRPALAKK